MKNEICMNCHGAELVEFIDLHEQPNGNVFLRTEDLADEVFYPLVMMVCQDCFQVQIRDFPAVDTMFEEHPYISGLSVPVVEHFLAFSAHLMDKFQLKAADLVMDIGANDGSLLQCFDRLGTRTLGVDPSKCTAPLSKKKGIEVVQAFWNRETASTIKSRGKNIKLITATAVFYHVEDLHEFIEGLIHVMDDSTVFCAQCVDLLDIIALNQFDHFYHEHTMIHAISPLKRIFEEYGLKVIDVEEWDIHGGSFVVYVAKSNSNHDVSPRIEERLTREQAFGLQRIETYRNFAECVRQNRADLRQFLKDVNADGKTVVCLGAPLKGSTLLNYAQIGPDLVRCAVEVNPLKTGRLTPGTHIPVIHENDLDFEPDYYLCLAWNFKDFFLKKYATYLDAGGQMVFPHPQLEIVGTSKKHN